MDADGLYPPPDEATCLFRGEVKNHKQNPEWLVSFISGLPKLTFTEVKNRTLRGIAKSALSQHETVSVGFIRNQSPEKGAVKNLCPTLYSIVMSMTELIRLVRTIETQKKEIDRLTQELYETEKEFKEYRRGKR